MKTWSNHYPALMAKIRNDFTGESKLVSQSMNLSTVSANILTTRRETLSALHTCRHALVFQNVLLV